uniref:Chitin-binding type-2 domain-containing protein n=1 Tax=Syphacia muris TaxID=451379 RepID=A0A0N5ACD0_9BILA
MLFRASAAKNCTNDLDCMWFQQLCEYGQCQPNRKFCASPADCDAPLQCRYSHCAYPVWPQGTKPCNDDLQCTWFVELCQNGKCEANGKSCLTTLDCAPPMECRWLHCAYPMKTIPTTPSTETADATQQQLTNSMAPEAATTGPVSTELAEETTAAIKAITAAITKLSSEPETITSTTDAPSPTTPKLLTFTMSAAGMHLTCETYFGSTEVHCYDS